jgi:hypothetical protein
MGVTAGPPRGSDYAGLGYNTATTSGGTDAMSHQILVTLLFTGVKNTDN